jgi:hypothetical protein
MRVEGHARDLRTKVHELGLRIAVRGEPSNLRVYDGDIIVGHLSLSWRSGYGYLEIYE